MTRYVLKRLAYSILVLLGVSVLIFIIGNLVPGDPARLALGPRAPEWAVENLRREMNLDKPLVQRYFLWLGDALRGDFGKSLVTRRDVTVDIIEFLPATLEIVALSAIMMAVIGISLGRLSARYVDTWVDGFVRILSYLGIVTPAFVWAIIFILAFGYAIPIFPTIGRISSTISPPSHITGFYIIDGLITGNFKASLDTLWHILLPSLALAMGGAAQAARMTRATMVDNMGKDYILAARAYGIPARVINKHHLLKPSLIPTVSVMALDIAALIGNAFLVELLFNFPGLSRYGVNAMLNKDLSAITAVVLIIAIVYIVANIVIDIVVANLDPRIAFAGGRSNE